MIDGQFDVVFRGQIVKTMSLDEVKVNLGNLFKSSPEAVEKLFNGGEVVIKKSLDYTTAMKYQSAIKKAGALALIKEVETKPVTKVKPQSSSQGQAVFGVQNVAEDKGKGYSKSGQSPSQTRKSTQMTSDEPVDPSVTSSASQLNDNQNGMTLANVGAQIMPDKVYEKREVDTSELSLANAGERIMPKKPPENHPTPSIEHLQLEN